MEKQYKISGMSCNGCRTKVENALNELPVISVNVDLKSGVATIESITEIPIEELQSKLSEAGNYSISHLDNPMGNSPQPTAVPPSEKVSPSEQYQCPMFCEGKDKIYHEPGNCPICGMFLVPIEEIKAKENPKGIMPKVGSLKEQMAKYRENDKPKNPSLSTPTNSSAKISPSGQYQCPMFCEGEDKIYHEPGNCPVCGMFLVPVEEIKENNAKSAHSCCSGQHHHEAPQVTKSSAGKYYCPMHCEGDKLYDKPGSCPVCGMNLEKIPDFTPKTQYTCPMHPEVVSDEPGSCPKCGMDLVPMMPKEEEDKTYANLRRKFWVAVAFTIPIFILSMGDMLPGKPISRVIGHNLSNWLQLLLSLPVVFYATWMFFERAWTSFKTWNLNMFSLIGLGAGAAYLYSLIGLLFPGIFPKEFLGTHGEAHLYFESAVVILTLVLLGQLMEARAHSKTNTAIKELINLAPLETTKVENGSNQKIAVDLVQIGDILKIKAGDKIPVDGEIIEGSTSIDESMITGEPVPVDKKVGDKVTSGTINGNKTFLMKAERVGSETLLSQIIQMVNEASRSKAPIQKLTDKVSKIFVPTVVAIAVITFILWYWLGPEPQYAYAFGNLLAVLIVACPCALGLATPMSVMVGVGKGAKNGILIKNAQALETLNQVNVLVTDKTGTLTEGKPTVNEVVPYGSFTREKILAAAASLNQESTHPLATAIVNYAKEQHITLDKVWESEHISGKGMKGHLEHSQIVLGNEKLLLDEHIEIPTHFKEKAQTEQSQGKTLSYIAIDGKLAGFISISDKIKKSTKAAVQELMKEGVEVVMITGDNPATTQAVAQELGITRFIADALPEDKLNEIKRLQAEGKIVAMAGDGINDAPALMQANVGIAMDTGTDVAIESAEITLLKGDLKGIKKAIKLSHKMMKNIKQNLVWAFLYNTLGIPIAAGVFYAAFGWLLSPMLAAAAMSFSSVSVIANSLRLKNVKI